MFADICFPNCNEDEFIKAAKQLGTPALVMAYPDPPAVQPRIEGIEVFFARLAKGSVRGNPDLAIAPASDDTQALLRRGRIDIVSGLEFERRGDFVHHRSSGLNQVIASLARDKGALIGFDFGAILPLRPHEQARILGRIAQNIELCTKFKVEMAIASFARSPLGLRAAHDLASLFRLLGMDAESVKQSLANVYSRAKDNRERREGKIIGKGVREVEDDRQDQGSP